MQSYVILYNSKSFNNSRGERISLNLFQYSKLIFLILNSHLCYYTVEKVQSFVNLSIEHSHLLNHKEPFILLQLANHFLFQPIKTCSESFWTDLQIQHGCHQSLCVGQGKVTPLVENGLQLGARDLIKMEFNEPVPEGSRQDLSICKQTNKSLIFHCYLKIHPLQ